ncbi:MAG TPA: M48 family metallopeptidase [Rhizomicrobium sp.]|jgi:STE24 endopeptidase|nr:M48 family metallopeptidase [Rhizomicrobium sp.]
MRRLLFPVLAFLALVAIPALAQDQIQGQPPRAAPTAHVQVQQLAVVDATPNFDAARATAAYLAQVNGAARAKSDAYFEGGYWLMAVDLLWTLVVTGLLLWLGISSAIRDWAAERTHSRVTQAMIYGVAYVAIMAVAQFPLSVYEGFFREHSYGLSNQTFLAWLGDQGTSLALSLVAALIFVPLLYGAIRRARESWWLWGAGLVILFQIVTAVIFPLFIAPLFNHYSPLPDSPLKAQILSVARANDIPADNVWLVDASRQSNRISANVSGFLGTTRISLNDNLLHQGTHDEVLAVLGHEMGHYVMGHMTRLILLTGLVIIVAFAFMHWGFIFATELFGGQWQVRRVEDIAGLPLLVALFSVFFFLATPITNTISRTTEHQADVFGLDAVRKPDAFATIALKLSTYRKLEPGKWEEIIFYDHPSGRTRIMDSMVWKKEHIRDVDIRDTVSPQ